MDRNMKNRDQGKLQFAKCYGSHQGFLSYSESLEKSKEGINLGSIVEYGWVKKSEFADNPLASICLKSVVFRLRRIGFKHHEKIKALNSLGDYKGTCVLLVFSSLLANTIELKL